MARRGPRRRDDQGRDIWTPGSTLRQQGDTERITPGAPAAPDPPASRDDGSPGGTPTAGAGEKAAGEVPPPAAPVALHESGKLQTLRSERAALLREGADIEARIPQLQAAVSDAERALRYARSRLLACRGQAVQIEHALDDAERRARS